MKFTPAKITQPDRTGLTPASLDTETGLIGDTYGLTPPMVCTSYAVPDGADVLTGVRHRKDPKTLELVRQVLAEDSGYILVGANITYDLGVWMNEDPSLTTPIFLALDNDRVEDVQTRQKLIDNAFGRLGGEWKWVDGQRIWVEYRYNLAALETRLLGIDRSAQKGDDAWRMRYIELIDIPIEQWPTEAQTYPVDDAVGTLAVYMEQQEHEPLLKDSFRQQRAHFALHLESIHGVRTDAYAVQKFEQYTRWKMDRQRDQLLKAGLIVESKKPTAAQKEKGVPGPWFKKKVKLAQERMNEVHPDGPKTDGGAPKLDADACKEAADPILIAFQEFSSTSTKLSIIEDLRKGINGRIRTRYEILKDTGRTGSSYPNIQNRDKKFGDRECFIPDEGCVFIQADFEMLELRTLAQICLWKLGYSSLADAINAGMDVHLVMAANLLGCTYAEAVKGYKAGIKKFKDARQLSKIANFGFGGGMAGKAFVMQARTKYNTIICDGTKHQRTGICEACIRDSYDLRTLWKRTWPECQEYLDVYIPSLVAGGTTTIIHPYSERQRGNVSYTEGANTFFQGLGSDAAKQALWDLSCACYVKELGSILYGTRPQLFIHDEILGSTWDDSGAHDRALEWSKVMCDAADKWIPDVPMKAPPVLMRRWSKNAEAVFDEAGRLIPWDCDIDAEYDKLMREAA